MATTSSIVGLVIGGTRPALFADTNQFIVTFMRTRQSSH